MLQMSRIAVGLMASAALFSAWAQSPLVAKAYLVSGFDQVVADGYYNLTVQASNDQAQVNTASYAEAPITVSVQDRTLYIVSRYAAQGPYAYYQDQPHPHVELKLPAWQGLSVYGPVNVTARGIPTQGFTLVSEGYGAINLQQVGRLRTLKQHGTSVITLSGIRTDSVSVDATGSSDLTMAGVTDYFYARLDNQAKVQAKGLAANHVIVQARGNAQAYVYPLQSLRAFTDQSGAIYYYKHAPNMTLSPSQSGNVFEMKW